MRFLPDVLRIEVNADEKIATFLQIILFLTVRFVAVVVVGFVSTFLVVVFLFVTGIRLTAVRFVVVAVFGIAALVGLVLFHTGFDFDVAGTGEDFAEVQRVDGTFICGGYELAFSRDDLRFVILPDVEPETSSKKV